MTSTFDLKTLFLEVLKTPKFIQLQVKESQVPYQPTIEPLPQYLIGLIL